VVSGINSLKNLKNLNNTRSCYISAALLHTAHHSTYILYNHSYNTIILSAYVETLGKEKNGTITYWNVLLGFLSNMCQEREYFYFCLIRSFITFRQLEMSGACKPFSGSSAHLYTGLPFRNFVV
jgi:hypothetical protein